jgi:hypothetical protein
LSVSMYNLLTERAQKLVQHWQSRKLIAWKLGVQCIEDGAKDGFAVGITHWIKYHIIQRRLSQQYRQTFVLLFELGAVTIVSKANLYALPDSRKRMHIFQRNCSLRRIPNVRHHIVGSHGILLHQMGNRRRARRFGVVKTLQASSLVDADSETVRVHVGFAAAFAKATEAKGEISLWKEKKDDETNVSVTCHAQRKSWIEYQASRYKNNAFCRDLPAPRSSCLIVDT